MDEDLVLGFVNFVGMEDDGRYRYEFIFTDNIDEFWGEDFEYKPCSMINHLMPYEQYKTKTCVVKSHIKFDLVQNNSCFGMQDCLDGCIAVCWYLNDEDRNDYLYFMAGETYDEVEIKLAKKNILFDNG
jgi:hypothetical protein